MTTNIATNCSVSNVVRNGNTVTFDLSVTAVFDLTLDFDGGITGLSIITAGYTSATLLKTEAVNHYKEFACLRGMDFMATNGSIETTWANRVNSGRKAGPKPWEAFFAFVSAVYNASSSKLRAVWICVPHQANVAYLTNLATLASTNLPAGITVYVEYSNELWNSVFSQQNYVYTQANDAANTDYALVNTPSTSDPWERMKRLWMLKVARMAKEFKTVFGTRSRAVLAGQFVAAGAWTSPMLAWANSNATLLNDFGAPSNYVYSLSGAPYPQGSVAEMDGPATAAAMLDGLTNTFSYALATFGPYWNAWTALKNTYGIPEIVAYEWGPHTHNQTNTNVKYLTAIDAGMQTLVEALGNAMWNNGWNLICYFTGSPNKAVSTDVNTLWACRQHFTDASPKQLGLNTLIAANPGGPPAPPPPPPPAPAPASSWYESDAIYAWNSTTDVSNSAMEPQLGGTIALASGAGASISGGYWDNNGASSYGGNNDNTLTAVLDVTKPFVIVQVYDKDNLTTTNYRSMWYLANFPAMQHYTNGSGAGFTWQWNGPAPMTEASYQLTFQPGANAYWLYYDQPNGKVYFGHNQTEQNVAGGEAPPSNISAFLTRGLIYRAEEMKYGTCEIVHRTGLTLTQAKAIVQKVQDLHGI